MMKQEIEQLVEQAKTSFQAEKYKEAIRLFQTAHQHYAEQGDKLNAAEMANNLSVAYLQDKQNQKAYDIVRGTDQIFAEAGETLKQAIALGNIGAALEARKKFQEAEEAYQQSADLFEQVGEKEMRSTVLKSLSALAVRQGKQIESIFQMQKSLASKEKLSFKDRVMQQILKLPFKFLGK